MLITADWRTLARRSHSERTLGIHHMQQCTARPWEKVFSERLCIRAWGKVGYYPFTRLSMVMLAREQIYAKRDREGRAKKAKTKRRTHAMVAKAIKNVSAVDAMAIVNAADPRHSMLPTLAEVTGKSKFPASLLAMKKLSPSETKVIDCLEKKEAYRAPE